MVSNVTFCREVRAEKPSQGLVTRRLSRLAEAISLEGRAGPRFQGGCCREDEVCVSIVQA